MLTGGAGFLGSFVTERLKARGSKHIFIPKEQDYDLRPHSRRLPRRRNPLLFLPRFPILDLPSILSSI